MNHFSGQFDRRQSKGYLVIVACQRPEYVYSSLSLDLTALAGIVNLYIAEFSYE